MFNFYCAGYINKCGEDPKAGFYFSAACAFASAASLFLLPSSRAEPHICGHHHHHHHLVRQHQAFCGDQRCPLFHHAYSEGKGCYEVGPTDVADADAAPIHSCVCTCRRPLNYYQRTMSWAASMDVLDQAAAAAGELLDGECMDDELADIAHRPELLTCISEEGLVEMVDPGAEGGGCDCGVGRTVVSPKKYHAARCVLLLASKRSNKLSSTSSNPAVTSNLR